MATLYFANLPHDCSDAGLQRWVESHGLKVEWMRVIRDAASGSSSAFAYAVVEESNQFHEIIRLLNGGRLNGQAISVRELPFRTHQDLEKVGSS